MSVLCRRNKYDVVTAFSNNAIPPIRARAQTSWTTRQPGEMSNLWGEKKADEKNAPCKIRSLIRSDYHSTRTDWTLPSAKGKGQTGGLSNHEINQCDGRRELISRQYFVQRRERWDRHESARPEVVVRKEGGLAAADIPRGIYPHVEIRPTIPTDWSVVAGARTCDGPKS